VVGVGDVVATAVVVAVATTDVEPPHAATTATTVRETATGARRMGGRW